MGEIGRDALNIRVWLVDGLATTRQDGCNGNCEVLVAAETFGVSVDISGNSGER